MNMVVLMSSQWEQFGNIAYLSCANEWDIPEDENMMEFGNHPHDSVYVDFFQKYIYDKVR